MNLTMKFRGMLMVPDPNQFRLAELKVSSDEEQQMFHEFDSAIREAGTKGMFEIDLGLDGIPMEGDIRIRFHRITPTSAFFELHQVVNDQHKHIHGVGGLILRANPTDDQFVVDHMRKFACLKYVEPAGFDGVLAEPKPVVAMFFADMGSANFPPLHNVIKTLGAAFFAQHGVEAEPGGPVGPMHA
ncbi:hypothetical protein BH09PLA1_BH09PLA1_01510 [soil metagenome]